MPNDEFSATLSLSSDLLSKNYENLGVRVLNNNDTLDETWPTNKFRKTVLLPAWYASYLNRVGGASKMPDDETSPSSPETGAFTKAAVITTASSCTMLVTLCISLTFLHVRKSKRQ